MITPEQTSDTPSSKSFFERIGPGMMFAASAVGVSHLVFSTQAGSQYGFSLVWLVILIVILKYPAFRFAVDYASATGQSLVTAYSRISRIAMIWLAVGFVVDMFIATGAVALVTAALINHVFGLSLSAPQVAVGLMVLTAAILLNGHYAKAERIVKLLVLGFTALAIVTTAFALPLLGSGGRSIAAELTWDRSLLVFVIAMAGWMPVPTNGAILLSKWVCEKRKATGNAFAHRDALADFRLGYVLALVIALCFVTIGTAVLFETGREVPASAAGFATEFFGIFTTVIGQWSYPLIAATGIAVIWSSQVALMDALPRVTDRLVGVFQGRPSGAPDRYMPFALIQVVGVSIMLLFMMRGFASFHCVRDQCRVPGGAGDRLLQLSSSDLGRGRGELPPKCALAHLELDQHCRAEYFRCCIRLDTGSLALMDNRSETVRLTGGEAMLRATLANGVDTIFGLPGAQIYPLFDAIHRSADVRAIISRHEQGAAYMANGYSAATGRPGVFSVVPGPGVLNASAALCTAVAGNLPVLCLTGQVMSEFLGKGRGHLHELRDQRATLASIIKWADRIDDPATTNRQVNEAFRQMLSGRPGPASVEMCWDTMAKDWDVEIGSGNETVDKPALNEDELDAAAELIAGAKNIMIMSGSGARHASAEVRELVRRCWALAQRRCVAGAASFPTIAIGAHRLSRRTSCGQRPTCSSASARGSRCSSCAGCRRPSITTGRRRVVRR